MTTKFVMFDHVFLDGADEAMRYLGQESAHTVMLRIVRIISLVTRQLRNGVGVKLCAVVDAFGER